jgi:hypothetical protein
VDPTPCPPQQECPVCAPPIAVAAECPAQEPCICSPCAACEPPVICDTCEVCQTCPVCEQHEESQECPKCECSMDDLTSTRTQCDADMSQLEVRLHDEAIQQTKVAVDTAIASCDVRMDTLMNECITNATANMTAVESSLGLCEKRVQHVNELLLLCHNESQTLSAALDDSDGQLDEMQIALTSCITDGDTLADRLHEQKASLLAANGTMAVLRSDLKACQHELTIATAATSTTPTTPPSANDTAEGSKDEPSKPTSPEDDEVEVVLGSDYRKLDEEFNECQSKHETCMVL